MKHFPIKKKESKRKKIFIQEGIRASLPKPKIPLMMLWNIHKVENYYFDSNFLNSDR